MTSLSPKAWVGLPESTKTVAVGQIEPALMSMFASHGATQVHMVPNKGFGFIEFDSEADRDSAITALDRKDITVDLNGVAMKVKMKVQKTRPRNQRAAPKSSAGRKQSAQAPAASESRNSSEVRIIADTDPDEQGMFVMQIFTKKNGEFVQTPFRIKSSEPIQAQQFGARKANTAAGSLLYFAKTNKAGMATLIVDIINDAAGQAALYVEFPELGVSKTALLVRNPQ